MYIYIRWLCEILIISIIIMKFVILREQQLSKDANLRAGAKHTK